MNEFLVLYLIHGSICALRGEVRVFVSGIKIPVAIPKSWRKSLVKFRLRTSFIRIL